MQFRQWLESTEDWAVTDKIPSEPGTTPMPPRHVRLYHYTAVKRSDDESRHEAADSLRKHGLDVTRAKGNTYGEPNVVWASTSMPGQHKVFAEFAMSLDDPRWLQPHKPYEGFGGDCYFSESIRPNELMAVHEPWHFRFRYLMENPELIEQAKAGEFDHLLDTSEYAPAIRRVKAASGKTP